MKRGPERGPFEKKGGGRWSKVLINKRVEGLHKQVYRGLTSEESGGVRFIHRWETGKIRDGGLYKTKGNRKWRQIIWYTIK